MSLTALLDNAFSRYAGRIALDDGRRRFTYRELDRRTRRLGHALLALGLRPGDTIATVQHNSVEMVEFDLAAARFGLVRTLLNVRAPAADHTYCLEFGRVKALVFEAALAPHIDALRPQLPGVEHWIAVGGPAPGWAHAYDDLLARASEAPPPAPPGLDDAHSLYFTSGTTGRPKGVVLAHRNWVSITTAHLLDAFPTASHEDTALLAAPLSHATGSLVLPHLARGARLYVIDHFDTERILTLFATEGITASFMAPTMIMLLMQHAQRLDRAALRLKGLFYGGAPFPAERLAEALELFGPCFVQGYGQWEAPVAFIHLKPWEHVEALRHAPHRLQSAGKPGTFARVAVLDDDGNELPPGSTGEIATAGEHLMVGYLDNPEATAELRVGPWQRTGDVGHIDGDGFVYITDRKKDMIITGGNNVYPRQVEEVLYEHPDVRELAVIGLPDPLWGETVHVVVSAREGRTFDPAAFLAWARDRLPTDRRPRSVDVVEELPKSHYGKILRRELRDHYRRRRLEPV
ncbi:AMP-binding protein [Azospirillum sp. TSO22-1]|uniref:AMP-binding protein n=1 Tax=Azospirillum sp. TSO22-1 TaxID=716789 RepID=UPI000D621DCF|nr:AMP-binding protein [Azospirillum sp. TSO22-1]PWC54641.1 hypothetical protein TSO221_08380 [Azospirillum sp. TSO22-1]